MQSRQEIRSRQTPETPPPPTFPLNRTCHRGQEIRRQPAITQLDHLAEAGHCKLPPLITVQAASPERPRRRGRERADRERNEQEKVRRRLLCGGGSLTGGSHRQPSQYIPPHQKLATLSVHVGKTSLPNRPRGFPAWFCKV